jgi:hypothetical protein
VQRLPPHLVGDRLDDFRIAMSDIEDAEAAETVEVGASRDVAIRVRAGVGPLDYRGGAVLIRRLAVFQESGIDVVAKRLDRLARDPFRLGGAYLRLLDQC